MVSLSDLLLPADESSIQRDLLSDDARGIGRKPLWAPGDAVDAAWELARGGAAVTRGEVVDLSSGAPERLAMEPWMEEGDADVAELQHRTRRWSVSRRQGETWEDFGERSAAAAAAMVHRLAGARAGHGGRGGLAVDLAWVTPDELARFELPREVSLRREALLEDGGPPADLWAPVTTSRVTRAGAVPGSYHSPWAAASVAAIPADARYAQLGRATKKMGELRKRGAIETLVWSGAQDKHLAAVPEGVRALHVTGTATSLAPVAALAGLRILSFDSERKLKGDTPLAPLAKLAELRFLELRPAGMRDLGSLPPLTGLTSFHFRSFADRIESLAPLGALTGLRYLTVYGPAVRDQSLAALASLRRLRHLGLWTGALPLAEYARLANALPHVEGTLRMPFQRPEPPPYAAPKCGDCGGELVHTLGRPRRTFCAACEPQRAMAYQAEWEVLRSAGAW